MLLVSPRRREAWNLRGVGVRVVATVGSAGHRRVVPAGGSTLDGRRKSTPRSGHPRAFWPGH